MGIARIAASHSLLPEYPFEVVEGTGHVRALAERFSISVQHLRTAIEITDGLNEQDTNDLYYKCPELLTSVCGF